MSEIGKRLTQVAKDFNIGTSTISEFLLKKGLDIGSNPNARITPEMYRLLEGEFQSEKNVKEASEKLSREHVKRHTVSMDDKKVVEDEDDSEDTQPPLLIKDNNMPKAEVQKTEAPKVEASKVDIPVEKSGGLKVVGKIELEGDRKAREKKEADEKSKLEAERIAAEKEIANEKARLEKIKLEEEAKAIEAAKKAQEVVVVEEVTENSGVKVVGRIDLDSLNQKTHPGKGSKKKEETRKEPDGPSSSLGINKKKDVPSETPKVEVVEKINPVVPALDVVEVEDGEPKFFRTEVKKLTGPKVLGKIELPSEKIIKKQPVASSADDPERQNKKKKKRKRLHKEGEDKKVTPAPANPTGEKATLIKKTPGTSSGATINKKKKRELKPEVSEEDIQKQIKETLARLSDNSKSKAVKYRRHKRDLVSQKEMQEIERAEQDSKVLKVTEFVSANELANMMNLSVNQIISTCMTLGMFVSINQRLDAETIVIVAEEFGYRVEFVSADLLESMKEDEIEDNPEDYVDRPPIVTVMGHVDHGKTSLLDYIRKTNVIAGEAGGITQHIGAYEVMLESGKHITFLDTPGHEAFTAMRARGSKITDIAVIVVAADDNIMPQTREAINHAQAANVPMVFAINKIDKPNAQPEKIKESLAAMNLLVEDWGGKYQSQDIAAKHGLNVDLLMEKILLEAELLELKGNPKRQAQGVVLEASLDKGKGYVAKILVQNGTLNIGDMVLAGTSYGKVKAMFNERNQSVKFAGPSVPVLLLGLNSAPQAGDTFTVMADEKEAKGIATKREQLQREQGVRTQKHITLDEIGRRLAIGDFKELNIIVKADMDGSVEALSDSLIKLSTEEIQVNIIHKSVGQVSESDVLLASASDAIIIAFQVRPSLNARKLAEQEQIDIRIYSVIYKAIEEVKAAMEGMLSPDVVENIVCSIEIRDVFKITKVGSVAGCYVMDGKVTRNTPIRIIRDGIVVYSGKLGSLKRFKDDVKEVNKGFECGLNIDNFNDIKVGDIIEGYELTEVKRTLA